MSVTFDAEHLVNLELNEKLGVGGPEQAIIRLHQLHASKVLQPARVHLCLESSHLSIIDVETHQVVEKLPYPEVEAHEELFVRSVSDRHKNLLLLTVIDPFGLVPPEFFILQFSSSSPVAKEFLDKFKEFKKSFKSILATSSQGNGVAEQESLSSQQAFHELQAKQAAQATLKYKGPTPHKGIDQLFYEDQQPQQQQSQQLLNKYMELLNRCLDDVEGFVGRLRVAASNYQELEGWREQKKYGAHGGGIRMMRSQPPPSAEFHAIFQKIKLAFNILPKLKGHIKTPNAPELVHFLVQPLDLIVEASCAVLASNEEPIWEHTIQPLLNPDTLGFLDDCLVSNEADLLKSLGTPWNISSSERDFWLSCVTEVPAYTPLFADGWSPSEDVMTHISIPIHPSHQLPTTPQYSQLHQFSPSQKFPQSPISQLQQPLIRPISQLQQAQSPQQPEPLSPQLQQPEPTPRHQQDRILTPTTKDARPKDLALDGGLMRSQDALSSDPYSRKSFSPSTPFQNNSPIMPPPISPIIQLPHQLPSFEENLTQSEFINSILSKGSMAYITIMDHGAGNDQELEVKKGEPFEVLESNRLHSKVRGASGLIGYLPSNILQPLSLITEEQQNEIGLVKRRGLTPMDRLNKEFQQKLTNQPPEVPKKREAAATIIEKSSPQDVAVWLASKGFDQEVQLGLSSFGGKQLFLMDKRVLERLFGGEVGGRLYSQVLVQRNKSGFKTMRAKELNAILEGRKKKADSVLLTDVFKLDPDNDTNSKIYDHF